MVQTMDKLLYKTLYAKDEQFFVGREKEFKQFKMGFDPVLNGEYAICTVSGEAGFGKTHFIVEAVKQLSDVNITYVSGKYKHHDDVLFSAFNEVIRKLVEHILTLPENRLHVVKRRLRAKLGDDANLIIAICPYAEKLLGYYRKIDSSDYNKLEYKFDHAIYLFLDIMSQELYPLIIHFDDLQWADEGSLRLISYICKSRPINIYLVLSYRSGDAKASQIQSAMECEIIHQATVIDLHRLNNDEVRTLISLSFEPMVEDLNLVSRYIYKATLGSPFYMTQLMKVMKMHQNNFFNFESNSWQFDKEFLMKLQLPEDILNVLMTSIDNLSVEELKALKLLSCLGGAGAVELLHKLSDENLIAHFDKLCKWGLVLYDGLIGNNENYYFSHDIIYEMMYESIDESEKEGIHHNIVHVLIDNPDKVFVESIRTFIASQILKCLPIIRNEEDQSKYVVEMYYAGVKAKNLTMVDDAKTYFETCLQLMEESDVSYSEELIKNIKFEYSECLFISGLIKEAQKEFEQLIIDYQEIEDLIHIKSKFSLLYTYSGDYDKVLSLSMEILSHLGYKVDIKYKKMKIVKELVDCKRLLASKQNENLYLMPSITNPRIEMICRTILRMSAVANLIDDEVFILLILKLGNITLKYGNSDYSGPAYAAVSFILLHLLGDVKKAVELSDISASVSVDNDAMKCMTFFILGAFIDHWKNSAENSANLLMKVIEYGIEDGEFQYAGYAYSSLIEMKYVMGMPLFKIYELFQFLNETDERLNHDITHSTMRILKDHLDLLSNQEDEFSGSRIAIPDDKSQKLTYYFFKMQRLYLKGAYVECFDLLPLMEPHCDIIKGFITEVDLFFYMTLTRLEIHKTFNTHQKIGNKRKIASYMKRFKQWIDQYSENHNARYMYLKGKYIEVFNSSEDAGRYYEEGIAFAKSKKQLQLIALGQVFAAKYYETNPRISRIYIEDAIEAFEEWGALYYVDFYSKQYNVVPELFVEVDSNADETASDTRHNQDLTWHMRNIETMDKDNTYLYLLDMLVNVNKATYGAIYLEHNDQIYMAYERTLDNIIKHDTIVPVDGISIIPQKIIRYVERTGEEVVMRSKPVSGLFSNDIYFDDKEHVSLICIPLKYMDVFVGVIFMEWLDDGCVNELIIEDMKQYMPILIAKTITEDNNESTVKEVQHEKIPLTKREIEVFELLIKGLTNKQIGETLNISLSTVKTHIINIYSKLNIKNRVAAVEKARFYGYIS